MAKKILLKLIFLFFIVSLFICFPSTRRFGELKTSIVEISAEEKMGGVGKIPKLPKALNDPELLNGHVYPFWGSVCQKYTYSVIYRDKEGRQPEYAKIFFNGQMIDLEKENPQDNNYQRGIKYIYKFVPNKIDSNFYYFEASNGLGKARDSIIDSPDNGPVLFESDFSQNEVAVIDKELGKKIFSFTTGKEWIGGVALSDDGKSLAVKTSCHIYLFDTLNQEKPIWEFKFEGCRIGGDVKGGIDISGDGSKIIASIGEMVIFFDKKSSQPIWKYQTGNAYNVAISRDGEYLAAATAGEESNSNSNLLILWNNKDKKPLWQYHSSGNFHDVSLSDDGQFIAGATGCPDRRAYIFSRDSNIPLLKSDMLTYDSPVSKSKISADGTLATFSTEGGPDSSVVLLFSKDKKEPLWKFSDGKQRSSRALGITPDGKFIGVATMNGDVYLLNKNKNQPINQWSLNMATGALDIADDGSFLAVGGTDNKVYLLDKNPAAGGQKETSIDFKEFIADIDISANNKYVAVGTGGSIYFFESYKKSDKTFPCTTVIEPPKEDLAYGKMVNNCQNCQNDSKEIKQSKIVKETKLPGMIFGFGLMISLLGLGVYGVLIKIKKFVFNKIVIFFLSGLAILFFVLTIITILINRSSVNFKQPESKDKLLPENIINYQKSAGVCGNDLCEPDLGESQDICPKDCLMSNKEEENTQTKFPSPENNQSLNERLRILKDHLHALNSGTEAKQLFPDLTSVYIDNGHNNPQIPKEILPFTYYYSQEADVTISICHINQTVFICPGKLERLINPQDYNRCQVTPEYLQIEQ